MIDARRLFSAGCLVAATSFAAACAPCRWLLPETKVAAPARPCSVPLDARWAGGPDGGAWLRCLGYVDGTHQTCQVWRDSGSPVAYGTYANPERIDWRDFDYAWSDRIGFSDGRLVPADGWVIEPDCRCKSKYRAGEDVPGTLMTPLTMEESELASQMMAYSRCQPSS